MKKNIIAVITVISILFIGTVNVKAEVTLEEKYKQAYDKPMNVVGIAQQYGVKPFYREGSSTLVSVVNAVNKGSLQKEILIAREYVNSLPTNIQLSKNTLSSILDDYQHPVYENIVSEATETKEFLTKELEQIDDQTNLLCIEGGKSFASINDHVVNRFDCMGILARKIHFGKVLIEDVPEPFKSIYSSALDESKQKILNWYSNLIRLVEKTKNEALKDNALYLLNVEKTRNTNGTDVTNYINSLIDRANKVFVKGNNGIQLACMVWDTEVELYSREVDLVGAVDFIKKVAPNEVDKIGVSVKTEDDKGFLTSNGLICMSSFDYKYKYFTVGFKVFK